MEKHRGGQAGGDHRSWSVPSRSSRWCCYQQCQARCGHGAQLGQPGGGHLESEVVGEAEGAWRGVVGCRVGDGTGGCKKKQRQVTGAGNGTELPLTETSTYLQLEEQVARSAEYGSSLQSSRSEIADLNVRIQKLRSQILSVKSHVSIWGTCLGVGRRAGRHSPVC